MQSNFKQTVLENFTIHQLKKEHEGLLTVCKVKMELKNSFLLLQFDNDGEGSTHSYVARGQINDGEVKFANNIRIGMSIDDFSSVFFEQFPQAMLSKINVIILDYCINDIIHIYNFKNGKLSSVNFVKE